LSLLEFGGGNRGVKIGGEGPTEDHERFIVAAGCREGSVESADDFAGDGEAESDAFAFPGDEGITESIGDVGVYAGTVVGDEDAESTTIEIDREFDDAVGAGGFDGVEREIEDRDAESLGVGDGEGEIVGGGSDFATNAMMSTDGRDEAFDFGEDVAEVAGDRIGELRRAEREEALDLIFDELQLDFGSVESSAGSGGGFLRREGAAFLVVLNGESGSGEGVAEGVCEAAGELSEESETFGFGDLGFEFFETECEFVGGVLEVGEFDDGADDVRGAVTSFGEVMKLGLYDANLTGVAGGEPRGERGGEGAGEEGESDDGPDDFTPGDPACEAGCEDEDLLRGGGAVLLGDDLEGFGAAREGGTVFQIVEVQFGGGEGGGDDPIFFGAIVFGDDDFTAGEDFEFTEDVWSGGEAAHGEDAGDVAGVEDAFGSQALDGEGGSDAGGECDHSEEEDGEGDQDLRAEGPAHGVGLVNDREGAGACLTNLNLAKHGSQSRGTRIM